MVETPTPDLAGFVLVDSWDGGAQTVVVRMRMTRELLADLNDEELSDLLGPIAMRAARTKTGADAAHGH